MSELIDALHLHGQAHKGTTLGGLLQWAALHIQGQDEALDEINTAYRTEEMERCRLERALHEAKLAIEDALETVSKHLRPPVELARDLSPHINLMAGHGDPDYLLPSGMSVRHVDLRSKKPRKTKEKAS